LLRCTLSSRHSLASKTGRRPSMRSSISTWSISARHRAKRGWPSARRAGTSQAHRDEAGPRFQPDDAFSEVFDPRRPWRDGQCSLARRKGNLNCS
jgi:hypothetical protein